jgi:hypothetical protein
MICPVKTNGARGGYEAFAVERRLSAGTLALQCSISVENEVECVKTKKWEKMNRTLRMTRHPYIWRR